MNIQVDETVQGVHSNMSPNFHGNATKLVMKGKHIRPDSPTTLQACQELGLLVDDLKQKPIEDFRDPTVEEDMVEIRYGHYLKRFNQAVKDVMARKRRITRRIRNQQLEQEQQSHYVEGFRTKTAGTADRFFTSGSVSMARSPTASSPMGLMIPSPMATSFNRTISYFRRSHVTPKVKDLDEIIGGEEDREQDSDSPREKLERTLSQEVFRFNRSKQQKQREAKEVYCEQIRKIKMMEKIQERERNKAENEKKLALERSKQAIERKKVEEEKQERIKDVEKSFHLQKKATKEKIDQKLEDAKKKFDEEMEEKNKKLAERQQMIEAKRQQALERKEKFKNDELKMTEELSYKINKRLIRAEENHNQSMYDIRSRMKVQLTKGEGSMDKIRKNQMTESKEIVQSFIEKVIKKEDKIQAFKIKCYKEIKRKEAESTEKDKRLSQNQLELSEQYQERMKTLNNKFVKIQEKIEAKREQDNKNRKMKQELNRLNLSDKLENHTRLERKIQFDKLKVLDKEKHEQERVFWSRCQREITKIAKLEVSVQAKIERDRIEEGITQLTKKVYEANSSTLVTDGQKKLIKAIFQPEDYKAIEGKESKKEAERLAQLEQQEKEFDQNRAQSPLKKKL